MPICPLLLVVFSLVFPTTFFNTNSNNLCAAYSNGINSNYAARPPLKHQVNATLKKAINLKIRGASDFIVIKQLSSGILASSPLFIHFGSGIFAERKQGPWAERGVHVEMAVNGTIIEGMGLRTDQKGIVEQQSVKLAPLANILTGNGRYSVRFSVTDWKGRKVSVDCSLYFWDNTSKLVVSDIDGTVTKSDLWGMILGKAWIQRNVRNLYTNIKQRGYKIVYLSARPASVGTLTRKFLKRLKMPSGPLLLSPEPLGKAVKTAIKDPQRIKIICMERLQSLYNALLSDRKDFGRKWGEMRRKVRRKRNPFFAAFGNQPSDKLAYDALSVPLVFMVNPRGTVTIYRNGGVSMEQGRSYQYVMDHIDHLFPLLG